MIRFASLAAILLLVGCSSAQAGMMVGMGDVEPAMVGSIDLSDLLADHQSVPVIIEDVESGAGLAGSPRASSSVASPVANLSTLERRVAIPVLGDRLAVLNSALPPSPALDGLIKPPQA
jgi:hypothetical protein